MSISRSPAPSDAMCNLFMCKQAEISGGQRSCLAFPEPPWHDTSGMRLKIKAMACINSRPLRTQSKTDITMSILRTHEICIS